MYVCIYLIYLLLMSLIVPSKKLITLIHFIHQAVAQDIPDGIQVDLPELAPNFTVWSMGKG